MVSSVMSSSAVESLLSSGYKKMSRLSQKGEEVYKHITNDMRQAHFVFVKDGKVTHAARRTSGLSNGSASNYYKADGYGDIISIGHFRRLPNGNTEVSKYVVDSSKSGANTVKTSVNHAFEITPDWKIVNSDFNKTYNSYQPSEVFHKTPDRKDVHVRYAPKAQANYVATETKELHNYDCGKSYYLPYSGHLPYFGQPQYSSLSQAMSEQSKLLSNV